MPQITRRILQEKLAAWSGGVIPAPDLHKWVLDLPLDGPCEFNDWEGDGTFSVSKEVVAELEMIDMNFITPDDIPIFTEFLDTAPGGFGEAYIRFVSQLQAINVAQRMLALKHTEPYARHCQ